MKLTKIDAKNSTDVVNMEVNDEVVAESITINAHMGKDLGLKITAKVNGRDITMQFSLFDSLEFWKKVDGFKETVFQVAKEKSPEIGRLMETLEKAKNINSLSPEGIRNLVGDIVGRKPDRVEDFHGTNKQLQAYIQGIKEKHPGVEVRVGKVSPDGKVEMADSDDIESKCDNCPSKDVCEEMNEKLNEEDKKMEMGKHVGEKAFSVDKDYNVVKDS